MRFRPNVLILTACLSIFPAFLTDCSAQVSAGTKREWVTLGYELTLSKCRNGSYHTESIIKDQMSFHLEPETPTFSWDYTGLTSQTGDLTYYLRFNVSHNSRKKEGRNLWIGFGGRQGISPNDKQVTWAEKSCTRSSWAACPSVSVSGNAYSDRGETVTPTLAVKILYSGFHEPVF
jgi:hypothetical protein